MQVKCLAHWLLRWMERGFEPATHRMILSTQPQSLHDNQLLESPYAICLFLLFLGYCNKSSSAKLFASQRWKISISTFFKLTIFTTTGNRRQISPTWIGLVSHLCPSSWTCLWYHQWYYQLCLWSPQTFHWREKVLYFCPNHHPTFLGCHWSRTCHQLKRRN